MLPTQYFRPNMDSGWGTWIIRLLTGIDAFPWSPGNIPLYQTHLHTTGWNCCCMEKKSPCLAISWEGLVFRCYPNISLTMNICKHISQDTKSQLWEDPLSLPSFTGDFSAPCTCGFLQDMRPKSRWIQLPGNSPGTLWFLWLLCHCFMEGKCGINPPHTTPSPRISTMGQ